MKKFSFVASVMLCLGFVAALFAGCAAFFSNTRFGDFLSIVKKMTVKEFLAVAAVAIFVFVVFALFFFFDATSVFAGGPGLQDLCSPRLASGAEAPGVEISGGALPLAAWVLVDEKASHQPGITTTTSDTGIENNTIIMRE